MSVASLVTSNSQRSRATAIKSFEDFLGKKEVTLAEVHDRITKDNTGKSMFVILDKYGWFLVKKVGKQGVVLSKNTVLSYFGNVKHRPSSPYVVRVHEALDMLAIRGSELMAWSITLRTAFTPPAEAKEDTAVTASGSVVALLEKQSKQLEELLLRQTRVEERLAALELKAGSIDKHTQQPTPLPLEEPAQSQPKRARKRASKALATVWFEWFTAVPRMYESNSVSKATLHESRHAVAYMMMCLPSGFKLDPSSPAFKAKVHKLGVEAEEQTLRSLAAQGSRAIAVGSVIKAMRVLHKSDDLDVLLGQYRSHFLEGDITDPTPQAALPTFLRFT